MNTMDSRWCDRCRRHVLVKNNGVLHPLHVLLVLGTCGLWFPVYMILIVMGDWRCQRCGKSV